MTEPKEAYVTNAELEQAWRNWLHYHRGINCHETETRYFAYCHTVEQSFVDDMLLPEISGDKHVAASTARHVKLLASANYNAIISAYYARHPWK